jgi:hypothetical protein
MELVITLGTYVVLSIHEGFAANVNEGGKANRANFTCHQLVSLVRHTIDQSSPSEHCCQADPRSCPVAKAQIRMAVGYVSPYDMKRSILDIRKHKFLLELCP